MEGKHKQAIAELAEAHAEKLSERDKDHEADLEKKEKHFEEKIKAIHVAHEKDKTQLGAAHENQERRWKKEISKLQEEAQNRNEKREDILKNHKIKLITLEADH